MFSEKRETFLGAMGIILVFSLILTLISFTFATAIIDFDFILSYLKSPLLVLMNFLPVFFLAIIAFFLTNSLSFSLGLTSFLVMAAGIANRSKLTYRDDPLVFTDIFLMKEAGLMAESYKIPLSFRIVLTGIMLVFIIYLVYKLYNYKLPSRPKRFLALIVSILTFYLVSKHVLFKEKIYVSLGDKDLINYWIEAERFQSKGFIYPFYYSSQDLIEEKPEGYDENLARKTLEKYDYYDIDEDKKVHVIGIMLEAYNDFSKFPGLNIDEDVYSFFHKLQDESISGRLVTSVFAGGTVDTERAYLTGFQNQPKFNIFTNSFVWYMKEQGYYTEFMHPITGSFYNRKNVNEFIGFDNFLSGDNKFYKHTGEDGVLKDKKFFNFIKEGYEKQKDKNPYFHFSVTYQNHGPYGKVKYHDRDYLERKSHYSEEKFNIINNYLYGIKETGEALEDLVLYLKEEDEPIVLVLFGDHNPWLGEKNSVYKMLDIDLDLSKIDGFLNYYETPFIIWGNDEAKLRAGWNLKRELGNISPNYLMVEVFDALGWKGNEYMGLLRDLKEFLPVQHRLYFKEDGKYVEELSGKNLEKYRNFRSAEFYYGRNFKEAKNDKD